MTVVAPATTYKTSTALGHAESIKSAVFRKVDLPTDINLAGLMDWLTKRMDDSDSDIRSMMTDVNKRKVQKEALNELIAALRETKKNPDVGGGFPQVEPPLDDPKAIRGSQFFASLDAADQKKLGEILDGIYPTQFKVVAPIYFGSKTYSAGDVISAEEAAALGLKPGFLAELPPRMSKEHLDADISTLGEMVNAIGSHDEIEIIKLQSAISARGQLLQMVSNMLASFNKTSDGVIGNMR